MAPSAGNAPISRRYFFDSILPRFPMRRSAAIAVLLSLVLGSTAPVRPYTVQLADPSGELQIKWAKKRIAVALSTSLSMPGPEIKAGSDVLGALRRALSRWSNAANIQFVEVSSRAQSISPAAAGDGISLITIADTPENGLLFTGANNTGRTRVFYDPATGAISEADVVINPHPVSVDGSPVQFSTDGTPGTYDLESAFTHEIGHLLGLEHSGVIGATMQARQRLNGDNLSSATNRTLSEDDRAAVRGIYGPHDGLGAIEGKIQNSSSGSPLAVFGAHVWAENAQTGRVIASSITLADGRYRIESLPPGQYRVIASYLDGAVMADDIASSGGAYAGMARQSAFRTAELGTQTNVIAGAPALLNWTIVPPQNTTPALKPKLLGLNAQLSSVAVPLEPGKTYTLYVGGDGVDQVPGNAITVSSPFMTINPVSLTLQPFGSSLPVISFEVTVAANAPFGDYSLRLQANSGEVAYLAGGLTVDPGVNTDAPSPVDDAHFFVRQHYRDFLGRHADQNGLDYWTDQITRCGADSECIRARRLDVSAAFFAETEFQETGSFVYRLYKSTLGRRPRFSEFIAGRDQVVAGASLQANKQAFAQEFVDRTDFLRKYPTSMNATQFVDALLATASRSSGASLAAQRAQLLALYNGADSGRVAIIRQVADSEVFAQAEYNRAFVLMQYFGYLRRDPDERGFEFWLNVLESKPASDPTAYRSMVCSFLSSAEYQFRFGMTMTHTNDECGH
jgi:hypothetical protein